MDTLPANWLDVITRLGFPIVVCLWFMWRDYKFLGALTQHMERMEKMVEMLEQVTIKVADKVAP